MLPVKNNHPDLYDDIQKLFQGVPDTLSENTTHPLLGDPIYTHETYEKSHGRVETRCIKASTSLNAYLDWPGIAQVIQYRYIHKNPNTAKEKTNVRCGAIPQVMAALRNTALAVFRFAGVTQIADTMKYYASKPKLAVNLIN